MPGLDPYSTKEMRDFLTQKANKPPSLIPKTEKQLKYLSCQCERTPNQSLLFAFVRGQSRPANSASEDTESLPIGEGIAVLPALFDPSP